MSVASSSALPLLPPPSSAAAHATFSLRLLSLQLIETAEDPSIWMNRVKRQWGGGSVVTVRALLGTEVVGITPPQPLQFSASTRTPSSYAHRNANDAAAVVPMSGIQWAEDMAFDLTNLTATNNVLMLEVLNYATVPPTLSGISIINAHSFVQHACATGALTVRRPILSQRFAVHCFPNGTTSDHGKDTTTHAVLVVELQASSPSALAAAKSEEMLLHTGAATGSFGASSIPPPVDVSNISFSQSVGEPTGLRAAGSMRSSRPRAGSAAPNGEVPNLSIGGGGSAASSPPHAVHHHHSSLLCPLDYNFGVARVSSLKLFFPSCFLNATGEYVVSNVVCVMNNTEQHVLSLQLVVVPRGGERRNRAIDAASLLMVHPKEPIMVRPQQRAFFSITWGIGKGPLGFNALQESVLVQLIVGSADPAVAALASPIEFEVRCSQPAPDTENHPYHYWVNNTMLSNRPLSEEFELPYVRSVLPVQLLLHGGGGSSGGSPAAGSSSRDNFFFANSLVASSSAAAAADGGGGIVVRNRDHGGLMTLRGNSSMMMAPLDNTTNGDPLKSSLRSSTTSSSVLSSSPWYSILHAPQPTMDLAAGTTRFTLHMGFIRGLPMVFIPSGGGKNGAAASSSSGGGASPTLLGANGEPMSPSFHHPRADSDDVSEAMTTSCAPAFRISVMALQPGWTITRSETSPAYQTQSGGLSWQGDVLEVIKAPDASVTQCLRLDLNEVNLLDDDEIPIGCGIVSFSPSQKIPKWSRLMLAFYLFDSYSLYDRLNTSSLLLKETVVEVNSCTAAT